MSDSALGICVQASCDVFAGVCFDFSSTRHSFTENMCRCLACDCCDNRPASSDIDERAPLVGPGSRQLLVTQPVPKPDMSVPPQAVP
ncbi:hypothetical protein BD626DRAFT_565659 [Schizophyllum amplum]|uniref:Uncharacterized protein n=1 Tax=Schizophyllum amplum TaxID=97359 RepID=A0A550CP49_9AGAR|nr:hypothetical protein BD626DRAFT_565659 [Auriculariopsis ampla]